MEQNRALFRALRLERVVTFITIGLIVFVAALNILISLIMMVMEKTRDIAVLVSMGARREQVRRIFIWQGVLIGIIGTALGLIVGYTVAILAGRYHWISLSAEVYAIDYVPFAPRAIDAAAGGGGFAGGQLDCHGVSVAIGGPRVAGRGACATSRLHAPQLGMHFGTEQPNAAVRPPRRDLIEGVNCRLRTEARSSRRTSSRKRVNLHQGEHGLHPMKDDEILRVEALRKVYRSGSYGPCAL